MTLFRYDPYLTNKNNVFEFLTQAQHYHERKKIDSKKKTFRFQREVIKENNFVKIYQSLYDIYSS